MSQPTVEGGRNGADSILQEGQAVFYGTRIEGCSAHEHVLVGILATNA